MSLVAFGTFGRPHGVRGDLRFWPHNPESPLLRADRDVSVGTTEGEVREIRVERVRFDGKGVVVSVEGILDRESAASLNGLVWYESRDAFEPLADDEVYVIDLVGCVVRTEAGEALGTLDDVLQIGAADLLVVRDGTNELLVPNVPEFVERIDTEAREIVIRPIEGLLDGWNQDETKEGGAPESSS